MFKITLRVQARCSKHTRYNPERDGQAFRASCSSCQHAFAVYQKVMELRRLLGLADKEEVKK